MSISRRQALRGLLATGSAGAFSAPARRPNIVFALTDDQAATDMSCYGNAILKTPNHMALNIDLAPTVLDYAGIPIPRQVQGRSLRPLLEGQAARDWRRTLYYAYHESPRLSGHRVPPHYGVRTNRHKLIRYPGEADDWELFDLAADPNELRNLYGNPAFRGVAGGLKAELKRLRVQYKDNTLPSGEEE